MFFGYGTLSLEMTQILFLVMEYQPHLFPLCFMLINGATFLKLSGNWSDTVYISSLTCLRQNLNWNQILTY